MAKRTANKKSLKETEVDAFDAIEALLDQYVDDTTAYLGHERTSEQELESIRDILATLERRRDLRKKATVKVSGTARDLLIEAEVIEADEDEED